MKLILTAHGTAELVDDDNEQLWASDDDGGFLEEFGDDFIRDEDAEEIIEYLEEHGILEDDEGEDIEIEIRSLGDEDDEEDDIPF